jgi:hypothetical protein
VLASKSRVYVEYEGVTALASISSNVHGVRLLQALSAVIVKDLALLTLIPPKNASAGNWLSRLRGRPDSQPCRMGSCFSPPTIA